MKKVLLPIVGGFCVLVLAVVLFMNTKSTRDAHDILEESIRAQLIAISIASREILDIEAFVSYDSVEDVQNDYVNYSQTLAHLRTLAKNVGAEYIYALKEIDGEYMFVFDTDTENEEIFIPYEISEVHHHAFAGSNSADILNVEDIYGSYNTGAVPIWYNGAVVGIISTDIEDSFLLKSKNAATNNTLILAIMLGITMALLMVLMVWLNNRTRRLQERLSYIANHDNLTGLPNRQYLLDTLESLSSGRKTVPYALLFIDMDNFKRVNDSAGHDAGDELLRNVAKLLGQDSAGQSFRPAAGNLNVAARVGGDEFIQLVRGVSTEEGGAAAAQRLLDGFSGTDLRGYSERYGVGLSIGVALFPTHTDNFHVLIKYADIAMYNAKKAGKNHYRIYEEGMPQEKDPSDREAEQDK